MGEISAEKNRILEKVFGLKPQEKVDKKSGIPYLEVFSRNISRYLWDVFKIPTGKKSGMVYLVEPLLKLNKKGLTQLLRAMYDSDGYVCKDHREIEYSTKSKRLASQIQLLLNRFNIVSFKKKKMTKGEWYYSVFINGADHDIFAKEIGSNHPKKAGRMGKFLKTSFMETTNVDSIPFANHLVKKLRKKLRVRPKQQRDATGKDYWSYENNAYHVTSNGLKKLVRFYKARYKELEAIDVGELRRFQRVLERRKEFIASISELKKAYGLSYGKIRDTTKEPIRNTLRRGDAKYLEPLFALRNTSGALGEKTISLMNPRRGTLKEYLEDCNLSQATVAEATGISHSVISYHQEKKLCEIPSWLQDCLFQYEEDTLATRRTNAAVAYAKIALQSRDLDKIDAQTCILQLYELRKVLNIQNEEFSAVQASVTNFFSEKYDSTCITTISEILTTTLGLLEETLSLETKNYLELAEKLASSELFWDEVMEVEKVKPKYEWVYDLTVDTTHNFVANGIIAHNTSFLGALLLEIMRKYRILTVEDTLEIGAEAMMKLGYNIQPLKVRSALTKGGAEVPADEGIRASLRLGDSALIVGEVRSKEALALYEAMRIGASANVVAGTIHGDSPYGIFDRVVNDLGVPKTSFKATDLVVMCNPIVSEGGMKKVRRVLSITEVRKGWEDDPVRERGFVDLMKYNAKTDLLEPTADLINGESEILKNIGGRVKEWVGNWDAIWENIQLRGELKKMQVDYAERVKDNSLLEAEFSLAGNDQFHRISEDVVKEVGAQDAKMIKERWEAWLQAAIRERQMKKSI